MPKIKMRAWKRRVSHNALHALCEARYRRPKDIADVKVSKLLKIPDIDTYKEIIEREKAYIAET